MIKRFILSINGAKILPGTKELYCGLYKFPDLPYFTFSNCYSFRMYSPSSIMNIWGIQSEFYLRARLTLHTFIGIFWTQPLDRISFDKSFSSMRLE